jgi:PTS system mannose-specific IID component
MPALLPVAVTGLVYWLLGRKKWTPTKIILLIIVICLAGAATGILGVAK